VLYCRPIIKTYTQRLWRGPGENDYEVVGSYENLILDNGKNHYEVMFWREGNDPYPVDLDTNNVYMFRVIRCPSWDETFYKDKGCTWPAGYLDEISLENQSIWRNTVSVGSKVIRNASLHLTL
jgi:hypothetical protein